MNAHTPLNTHTRAHTHTFKSKHTDSTQHCACPQTKIRSPLADVSMQTSDLSPEVHVPFAQCMCMCSCLSTCYLHAFICVCVCVYLFQTFSSSHAVLYQCTKVCCASFCSVFVSRLSDGHNCHFLRSQTICHYSTYVGFYYSGCIKCVPRRKLP